VLGEPGSTRAVGCRRSPTSGSTGHAADAQAAQRSFEHLERFADSSDIHTAAWHNYRKRIGNRPGTGIWHETYLVRAGEYEAIYGNMPPHGLGRATSLVPMAEGISARQRLKRRVG